MSIEKGDRKWVAKLGTEAPANTNEMGSLHPKLLDIAYEKTNPRVVTLMAGSRNPIPERSRQSVSKRLREAASDSEVPARIFFGMLGLLCTGAGVGVGYAYWTFLALPILSGAVVLTTAAGIFTLGAGIVLLLPAIRIAFAGIIGGLGLTLTSIFG